MRSLSSALAWMVATASAATPADPFVLTEDGRSPYTIVLAADASASEQHAAGDLQDLLLQATGATLPIVSEEEAQARVAPRIFVGAGTLARERLATGAPVDWEQLGDEGFVLRSIEAGAAPDLVIAGGRRRGTMYGVYGLLDRLGFRWYTNRKTWYPQADALVLAPLDEVGGPAFMYREPYIREAFDADWAARNRVNSMRASLDEARGGRVGVHGVHTFDTVIPDSLYDEHPEYFPLIGGRRVTGYVQRCLTNPDVVRVAADNVIAWMDRTPDGVFFSVSQEDTERLCECAACTAKMEAEESPMGLYLDFVNQVAELVEPHHPDKYITTLAYWFTEKPPKTVRPRDNVFIRLCPISICVAHPFTECTEDASRDFSGYLSAWGEITDRIIIWHYNTNFKHFPMPFPNFGEFTADIATYHRNGVRGIFFQGSGDSPGGGDADLRAWVMARLLWDPYQDAGALVDEWLHAVYGAAYAPMRAWFDLMHAQVADPDAHLHIFQSPSRDLYPEAVVVEGFRLHETAYELAAGDETARYYIGKSRLALEFVDYVLNTGALRVVDGAYRPVGGSRSVADHTRLLQQLAQFEVTTIREESRDSDLTTMLRQRVETHEVVTVENEALRLHVIPELGGKIAGLIDKATGVDLLHDSGPQAIYYPVWGGYNESTAWTWGGTGFANPYAAELQGRQLRLTAAASGGLRFERTISLPERGARVELSSAIVNTGEEARTYKLICRVHLKGDPEQIRIEARGADGGFARPTPTEAKQHQFFPVMTYRYDGVNKPAGAWRLVHLEGGHTLEASFDVDQVAACHLITSESSGSARLQIESAEREVAPGDRIRIDHTWTVSH